MEGRGGDLGCEVGHVDDPAHEGHVHQGLEGYDQYAVVPDGPAGLVFAAFRVENNP